MTASPMTVRPPSGLSTAPLRIAVLAHYRHPIAEPYQGGLEMHTALLVDELTERGHDVTLVAKAGSVTQARLRSLVPSGFPWGRPDEFGENRSQTIADAAMLESLVDLADDVDVVLNNSLSTVPYLHLAELPVLTVLHTPATLEGVAELVTATDWQPGRRHVWAGVSRSTSRDWARWLPDVRWIPNGIDLPHWAPRTHSRPQRRHAVWSGRITPEKGLAVAVEAAELAGWRLSISGPIADADYFAREIAPRLNDRIRYVGHLRHAELPAFLRTGQVYLFTPLWPEPFGLALVEAMACGTPAAALPQGAVTEIVTADGGVVAEDSSAEQLAVAMVAAAGLDRNRVVRSVAPFGKAAMITAYEQVLTEISIDDVLTYQKETPCR